MIQLSLTVIALWLGLLLATPAAAKPRYFCEKDFPLREVQLARAEVMALLRARKFTELEAALSARLQRYDAGDISDQELKRVYDGFGVSDAALTPLIDEWQSLWPNSYSAPLAMGLHLTAAAFDRRGRRWASETSAQQMDEFVNTMARAREEMRTSVARHPRPIVSYVALITASMATQSWPETSALLDRANAVDPRNVSARKAAAFALQPKWQGSMQILDRFADEQLASGLTPQGWRSVRHEVLLAIAGDLALKNNHAEAIERYLEAQPLCTGTAAFARAGQSYFALKRHADAVTQYSLALERGPNNADVLRRRGMNYEALGQAGEAVVDLRRSATLGDSGAANELGRIYRQGKIVEKDLTQAALWYRKAAAKGHLQAAAALRELETSAAPAN